MKRENDSKSSVFFKYSENRPSYVNVLLCIACFISLFILTSLYYSILSRFISNENVSSFLASVLMCTTLFFFYYRDLVYEFKYYFKNFKKLFPRSLIYYGLGYLGMIVFNVIIIVLLKNISANESQVRDMLFSSPFTSMLSISIIAPFSEEIIFRKSLQPLIKNKWIYALVCGVLFGGAHILTNVMSGIFVISDLLYILPYGCLGASFALMDNESKTTFSSIFIHACHNTLTALILLFAYFGGFIQ